MKKSETEEMIRNDSESSIKTPQSTKTEFFINENIQETLNTNLMKNINSRINSINIIILYNDILMNKIECRNDTENLLFELIYLYWVKCRHFGYIVEMNHIMYMHDLILKNSNTKYLSLDLIVFLVNIEFKPPKKKSFDGMYI